MYLPTYNNGFFKIKQKNLKNTLIFVRDQTPHIEMLVDQAQMHLNCLKELKNSYEDV